MSWRDTYTRLWLALVVAALAGCAQLPDYARPRMNLELTDTGAAPAGVPYRTLRLEDFQAPFLDTDLQPYRNRINARSCLSIRPSSSTRMAISKVFYNGHSFFAGSIADLAFEARFIPSCSWINPKLSRNRIAYVLRHEQIHFALAELAARSMTREVRAAPSRYVEFGSSREEVRESLAAQLRAAVAGALEKGLQEHTAFDEDASMIYDDETQDRWFQEVQERLLHEK